MNPKPKLVHIDLNLIDDDIVCRFALNENLAFEYAEMVEAGSECPPITVHRKNDGRYVVEDGRTRLQSYRLTLKTTIPCLIYPEADSGSILIGAFKANCGGPCRVSLTDARHTMMQLMKMGWQRKEIIASFDCYPATMGSRLYYTARRTLIKQRCAEAISAMNKNPKLSLEECAHLYKIPVEDLSRYLTARTDKGQYRDRDRILVTVGQRFKGLISFLASTLKNEMEARLEGKQSSEDVQVIISRICEYETRMSTNIQNWQLRFSKIDAPPRAKALPWGVTEAPEGIRYSQLTHKDKQ